MKSVDYSFERSVRANFTLLWHLRVQGGQPAEHGARGPLCEADNALQTTWAE